MRGVSRGRSKEGRISCLPLAASVEAYYSSIPSLFSSFIYLIIHPFIHSLLLILLFLHLLFLLLLLLNLSER